MALYRWMTSKAVMNSWGAMADVHANNSPPYRERRRSTAHSLAFLARVAGVNEQLGYGVDGDPGHTGDRSHG